MFYLLLEKFNNYKNRINRMADNIYAYEYLAGGRYIQNSTINTNFNINDSLFMVHKFNLEVENQEDLNPDYLVLYIIRKEGEYPEGDDPELVISRWFVIGRRFISGHQYELTLRRDVIADYNDNILEEPVFIEKGTVGSSDPAIFNHEDMTFNQIKTSEALIKDPTDTAWIVGYIAEDHNPLTNETFTFNPNVDEVISGNFSDWEFYPLCDGNPHTSFDMNGSIFEFALAKQNLLTRDTLVFTFYYDHGETSDPFVVNDYWLIQNITPDEVGESNWYSFLNMTAIENEINVDNPSWTTKYDFNRFKAYIGKNIQFDDGVYKITLNEYTLVDQNWTYETIDSDLYNLVKGYVLGAMQSVKPDSYISDRYRYPLYYKLKRTTFYANPVKNPKIQGTYTYSIPSTVKRLSDAPYKMFAIPYYTGDKKYYVSVDDFSHSIEINKDLMLEWAYDIIKKMGGIGQSGSQAYDIQLLPYCPVSNYFGLGQHEDNASGVSIDDYHDDYTENYDFVQLKDANDNWVGTCFFCKTSTHEVYIDENPITVTDYKVENECDLYRLCSPNYSSVFEFNPAKNGGVEGYVIRYTYKPYQPFIYVAPKFSRLYGEDFKDDRGLILSGDFSLPVISDAWTNYQLTNKNYLLTFDRQIKNLEITQDVQRVNEIFGAMAGTVKGGVAGGITGGMAGGIPGAIAGAVVGTASSLAGGILDFRNNERLRRESIDYTKDQFSYSLRNIQALPNTLNKTSSIIAISKLFPFVEKYTCTEEEKEALRNKIKYNGMTIMRIGKIKDFIGIQYPTGNLYNYVKAKLIRCLDISSDFNVLEAIAEELNKGVFFEL